jgi:hypothetical protein
MVIDLSQHGIALPANYKAKRKRVAVSDGKRQRAHPERDIQKAVINYIRRVVPNSVTGLIPIEQGAWSPDPMARARYGAARKASGVLTGSPDAFSAVPGGRTIWWEFKAPKGRVSDAQAELHHLLRAAGHIVAVCRSIEDARATLRAAGVRTVEAAP